MLVENGAVNDRDTHGSTPSYWACKYCTADVVLRIVQIGAILTVADLQSFCDRFTVIITFIANLATCGMIMVHI